MSAENQIRELVDDAIREFMCCCDIKDADKAIIHDDHPLSDYGLSDSLDIVEVVMIIEEMDGHIYIEDALLSDDPQTVTVRKFREEIEKQLKSA